jgi:predicted AAA+ superfamily ATPase
MTAADLEDFGAPSLRHRLLRGGLPPYFLQGTLPEREFQEWLDAYWAKDIQELFRLERRHSFRKFLELLLAHSGGIFEASRYAAPCEVSRTTITKYLGVLEATFTAHVIRPFTTHRPTEIVAAPKVYGFDTGFVCHARGWTDLRENDLGPLWEHFVLNELHARIQTRQIRYWRDKQGHEVDFVLAERGRNPVAIECKWSAAAFDAAGLRSFRRRYPEGESFVVAHDAKPASSRTIGGARVRFVSLEGLIAGITRPSVAP